MKNDTLPDLGELEQAAMQLIAREIPRLCRGGSKSLTVPEVCRAVRGRPSTKLCLVSRQAHEGNSIDGRCGSLKERVPFTMPDCKEKRKLRRAKASGL